MVDLEFAIGEILKYSDRTPIEYCEDPEDPETEYVIVNTCGFLSSAREESEETLSYYDQLGKKLILMGCYVSVKDDAFLAWLKNLHSIVPFMSYSVIEELLLGKKSKLNLSAIVRAKQAHKESKEKTLSNYLASIEAPWKNKKAFVWRGDEVRAYIHAPFGYEYLKIAEGCDNNCTFCIIPTIRGRQQSRPIEAIREEVLTMLASGIKEIQILSQDTTRYGTDMYGEPRLMELLKEIDKTISESNINAKFRVYYLYPDILTLSHIDELAKLKHFLPYFDIPFQHASESVLKRMGRHYDRNHIDAFLKKIRSTFPNAFIRTAFILWFPWETDADFGILKDFIEHNQFESVGIFEYHDETLAASSKLSEKVESNVARARIAELTPILEAIYAKKRKARVWKKQSGYIMEVQADSVIVREELHAPEVDEYDEVPLDRVSWNCSVGEKVEYIL